MPNPLATPAATCLTARRLDTWGRSVTPSSSTLTPSAPDFKVPDMLPPDYIVAVRVDRRRSWRSAIDQSVSYFESNQDARLMDAYTLMSSAKVREALECVRDCL